MAEKICIFHVNLFGGKRINLNIFKFKQGNLVLNKINEFNFLRKKQCTMKTIQSFTDHESASYRKRSEDIALMRYYIQDA